MAHKLNPVSVRLGINQIWRLDDKSSNSNNPHFSQKELLSHIYTSKYSTYFNSKVHVHDLVCKLLAGHDYWPVSVKIRYIWGKMLIDVVYFDLYQVDYKTKIGKYRFNFFISKGMLIEKDWAIHILKGWREICRDLAIERKKFANKVLCNLFDTSNIHVFLVNPLSRFKVELLYRKTLSFQSIFFEKKFKYFRNLMRLVLLTAYIPRVSISEILAKYLARILHFEQNHRQVIFTFKKLFMLYDPRQFGFDTIELKVKGKFAKARRSVEQRIYIGEKNLLPTQTFTRRIQDCVMAQAHSKYGVIGVTVTTMLRTPEKVMNKDE